jgi:hypothetical protein
MCMRLLITDLVEENRRMMFYAIFHMTTHLGETDLDRTSPRLKAELGPPLIKMFRDPEAIRKSNRFLLRGWSYYDDEIQNVLRLLRSSAVTSKIIKSKDDNRQWVDTVLGDPNPGVALLKDSAVEMSQQWLASADRGDIILGFCWLYGYVNKVSTTSSFIRMIYLI